MAAVPLIMDKIRNGVIAKVAAKGGMTAKLFAKAFKAKQQALQKNQDTPVWNSLVFDKLRSMLLGGRVRYMLSGGGPLSQATQEFMNIVFCCPIGQGYGLTECVGTATTVWPNDRTFFRVGAPTTTMEIKLRDWEEGGYFVEPKEKGANPKGEVLLGGPQIFQGYFKNPEATEEAIWVDESTGTRYLLTGDIGEMHPDGVLQIIDRKKDLVKLSGGEYVSYGKLEPMLTDSNYVDNAMVYARSDMGHIVAVVTRTPGAAAVADDVILKDLQQILKKKGCVKFEIPKKIFVAKEEWSPDNDLTTAAMKLKRQNLLKFYAKELVALYE